MPANPRPIGVISISHKRQMSKAITTSRPYSGPPPKVKPATRTVIDEIADWFETLAKAERSHAGRFQKALDELD